MEIKITLPESFTVTARKDAVSIPVDITKLSADIIAKSVLHGLKQKIADGAANATMNACLAVTGNRREGEAEQAFKNRLAEVAKELPIDKINEEAERLSLKVLSNLYENNWGAERGEGPAEMDMRPVAYAMAVYKAKLAADIAGWSDMKTPERRRAVNAWLDAKAGRRDVIMAKVAEEAALDI